MTSRAVTVSDMPLVSRTQVVRTIAASLCFDQDPAPIRSLDKARAAAADITQALADAGIIELDANGDGAGEFTPAPKDEPPLPLQVS